MSFLSKIKAGLKKTRDNIAGQINNLLKSFSKIDEDFFENLEELLIMADVGALTAEKICNNLKAQVKKEKIKNTSEIKLILKNVLIELLGTENCLKIDSKPSVILIIGVNGVGKTTTIGKLAASLKTQGKSVILGAADTFRAAAIEQLEIWAERAKADVIKQKEGADPAAVVFDTIFAARARKNDVIICDTAGRLHNKTNLLGELAKINRIINRELPDSDKEVLLVLDATNGQNAINQAREFKNIAEITGIILTKLDGTAKGGVILAIKEELGIPVKFIGIGEQIDDLEPFSAEQFIDAILQSS